MALKRFTDKLTIGQILFSSLNQNKDWKDEWGDRCDFIPSIKLKKPNLIFEGARPLAVASGEGQSTVTFTLTNSDSRYRQPIGFVELDNIEYIETLTRWGSDHLGFLEDYKDA